MANYTEAHFKKNKSVSNEQVGKALNDAIKWDCVSLGSDDASSGYWTIHYNGEFINSIYFQNNKLSWPMTGVELCDWLSHYIGETAAETLGAYKVTNEGIEDVWKPKFHKDYPTYSSYYNKMHSFIIRKTPALKFLFKPEKQFVKVFG